VTTISSKEGLASDAVQSVAADKDGSVWIGTRQGLTRWKNGEPSIYKKANGLPGYLVESLFEDDGGRLWLYAAGELAYFDGSQFITLNGAVPNEEAHSLTGDGQGNLWLAGNEGLYHVREGRVVEKRPWPTLGQSERAKVIVADRGGVWISFWGMRTVSYFKDGAVRASYRAADGLGKGRIANLQLDSDGALWVATEEGGLTRIKDGHIATLTTKDGLPCDTIHCSIEDNDRSLWLYTACGLVRIARSELNAWISDPRHRVVTTVLDAADGVRLRALSPSSFSPVAARSKDGKLWFVTGDSVQFVDPRRLLHNDVPPRVYIERIVADRKTYWQRLTSADAFNVHLPARVRDLEIYYTAISLVAPEKVHFKYKLERQDQDWREVVNERQVQYSNLSPGNYHFRVTASNNSSMWNKTGDALDFSIAPAYYQTAWFYALCIAAFLTAIWGLYRLRLYQIACEFNVQLDVRVDERTRVARELHDTLLQTFHAVMLRLQVARTMFGGNRGDGSHDALQEFDEALELGDKAIEEGREAIQDMRSSTVTRNDLARALRMAGDQLASQGSATFDIKVQGASRDVHPILRDEAYRISVEAMRNAFTHAEAKAVEAEIFYGDSLRVRIRDDGKGIDPEILKEGRSGHYGLPGMRERAESIGAKLDVKSCPGAGTEIQLTIPGTIAFGGAASLFRPFRRKRKRETAARS
jgi:signal transduction histidine kinase